MELVYRETADLKVTLKQLSSQDAKKVATVVGGRPRNLGQACEPILLAQLSCLSNARLPMLTESYRFTANYTFAPNLQEGKTIL